MMVRAIGKIAAGVLIVLAGCGSSSPAPEPPAIKWLADQYFGDRASIILPDLRSKPQISIEIWTAGVSSGGVNYRDSTARPDAVLGYFRPMQKWNGGGSFARPYAPGDMGRLIEEKQRKYSEYSGVQNIVTVNAIDVEAMPVLRREIRKRRIQMHYSNSACSVVQLTGGLSSRRYIDVFVAGIGGRWGLRDPASERCVLDGMLEILGIDARWTMSRVDLYYPRSASRFSTNECLFAVAYHDGAVKEGGKVKENASCVTRARGAWSYKILWLAFERGHLNGGSITRKQFVKALSDVDALYDEKARQNSDLYENEAIRIAEMGDKYESPVIYTTRRP